MINTTLIYWFTQLSLLAGAFSLTALFVYAVNRVYALINIIEVSK